MTSDLAEDIKQDSVSVVEAAKQLERAPRTLYNLIHEGKIESIKVGHEVFIPLTEIKRILRDRKRVVFRHRKSA